MDKRLTTAACHLRRTYPRYRWVDGLSDLAQQAMLPRALFSLSRVLTTIVCGLAASFTILLSTITTSFAAPSSELETIYLQLRWHHQFQFAGYYAAIEKGFYEQEGLDVRVREGAPDRQPVNEILSGRVQYAEGNAEVLYQRLQGKPVVALASIFQHSPSVLLTLASSGIRSVHDLVGKKVMLADKDGDADFLTMLLNEGVTPSQLNILNSSYDINDLISGRVDAFNSYTTNEPYFLESRNIAYNIIDPTSYRVDFYSDIFFTSEQELRQNPQRVAAMLRATLKGWRYALDNPDEIIDLLLNKYQVSKSREHLEFEAQEMRKLIIPDLVQIGHMNPERWQHMASTFVNAGLIQNDDYLEGFLYDTNPSQLPRWVSPVLAIALLLLLSISAITVYLHHFNRRLATTQKTLQESEERFKALSAATYGGIIIHEKGKILECNSSLTDITGFSYDELVGMDGLQLIAPEDLNTVLDKIQSDYSEEYEVMGLHKDGSYFPLSIKGKNITYKGRDARVIELLDITERKATDEQLKLAASVFTHAREGIVITDPDGNIINVNGTFSQITGYRREEILGENPRFLKSGRHNDAFYTEMWASLLTNKQWSGELWNRRKNGELFAELVTISAVSDINGVTKNYVALFSDITEMKYYQQQLEHIAHYDPLTNLPNRMLLADRLHHAMRQCERRKHSVAVAYIDLDGFKFINDNYGHDVGDTVLVKLSALMNAALREGDTLARVGGDEFVAVLSDVEQVQDCTQIWQRLLEAAASPILCSDHTLSLSASIGATLYPQDDVDADELMRHADHAMYVAKQSGKNQFRLYDINTMAETTSTSPLK